MLSSASYFGVLRDLDRRGEVARLNVDDIQRYLMRCSTHADTNACTDAIIALRRAVAGQSYPLWGRGRRNAQDRTGFCASRLLRRISEVGRRMPAYAASQATDIDEICSLY